MFPAPTTGGRAPFAGREREQAEVHASYEHAAEGRGSVVVVTGEPGIGKTRLLEEVARHCAASGGRAMAAAAHEGGFGGPFEPWRQALAAAGTPGDDLFRCATVAPGEQVASGFSSQYSIFAEVVRRLVTACEG